MNIIDIIPGVKVYEEDHFSILFGCPPEIIKYFMLKKMPFPDYVVLPDTLHYRGILQNATEFVLYYHLFILQNFFKGKKLNILGEAPQVSNNKELLRLTLLGPTREEYSMLDGDKKTPFYEELYRESCAITLKDNTGKEVSIDGFVNFLSFQQGKIETPFFTLIHSDKNIYEIEGCKIDINISKEQFPPYDLRPDFVPRLPAKFGFDVLGGGSGFTPLNPCSGLVLNYNSEYMLIDCPSYLDYSLNARGISRNQIKSIFLSHIHDDHCNIFPLVLFNERIKFLCTREIFWMACKKLSLMTMHDTDEFYQYFDFVELTPYQTSDFYGLKVTPHYTVHSIPTIGATFTMNCNGYDRSIVYMGDNKSLPEIKKMVEAGTVKEEKFQRIYDLYHDRYDFFVADGGMGILHGDPRDSLESKSERVIFLHLEQLPEEFNTTFSKATHGKHFSIQEGTDAAYLIKSLHYLNDHYPGISKEWQNTILNNIRLIKYNTGDVIMKQGEKSNGNTCIILSGSVNIIYHDGKESKQIASNHTGDLIGEMALVNQVDTRSASIIAATPVTLGEIDGEILFSFMKDKNRIEDIKGMLETRIILEKNFQDLGLAVAVVQQIAWRGKRTAFKKGQMVFEKNQMGDNVYIALSGEYAAISNGKAISRLKGRDMFGNLTALKNLVPKGASLKTISDGEIFVLPSADFTMLIKSTPSLSFYINHYL